MDITQLPFNQLVGIEHSRRDGFVLICDETGLHCLSPTVEGFIACVECRIGLGRSAGWPPDGATDFASRLRK